MTSSAVLASGANALWAASSAHRWALFRRALAHPAREQERLLAGYLRANADTAFGRRHGFASISSAAEYRARVPLARYDDLAADIECIARGEPNVLTREPVRRLAWSSGSTRAAKLVPYTAGLEAEFRRGLGPWIVDLFGRAPGLAAGPAFWSVTPRLCREGLPESRIPIGFDDDGDYLGGALKRAVEAALAVPPAVAELESAGAARYASALFLLRAGSLRVVSVWHPSAFALLLDEVALRFDALLADLADGALRPPDGSAVPATLARSARRAKSPRRARELARLGPDDPSELWPRLGLVSAWADGHAALGAASLTARLPGVRLQPKGLISTEAFCSLPFAGRHPLAVRSHVFELLDESERPCVLEEARAGRCYELVVTTAGGLYRYRTGDLVEVDGFAGATPSVRFAGRADQVSDRRGEKLSEGFVVHVLRELCARRGLAPLFALLAPEEPEEERGSAPRYVLYLEVACVPTGLASELDRALSENPHYALCRAAGQLLPVRVQPVTDGDAAYLAAGHGRGQRLGDVKPTALSPRADWSRRFAVPGGPPPRAPEAAGEPRS